MRAQEDSSHIAVSLGSGYFSMPAHAGFLCELLDHGIIPTRISGASAGALVAGFYAAGLDRSKMREMACAPGMNRLFLEPLAPLRLLCMLLGLRGTLGAFRGDRVRAFLRGYLGDRRIEDCAGARLSIALSDFTGGRPIFAERGDLVDAIMASCALPGLFNLQRIGGAWCWDGGLTNSLPIDAWAGDPSVTLVLAHEIPNEAMPRERARVPDISFPLGLALTHQMLSDKLFDLQRQVLAANGQRVVIARTPIQSPRPGFPLTFPGRQSWAEQADICYEHGRETARGCIRELGLPTPAAGMPSGSC